MLLANSLGYAPPLEKELTNMKRTILLTVFAISMGLGSSQACYLSCPATPQMTQTGQQGVPTWFEIAWPLLLLHF
ncbi:MAG: hypothetical protein C5B51_05260 [Terriglobia bacterium]|nr:MAG: hypothetical protein C5B51_05260 [Terriglobia bacterium]